MSFGDAAPVLDTTLFGAQVIAPLLWYSAWSGELHATIRASVAIPAGTAAARAVVYAGVSGHAEAGGVADAGSCAGLNSTVNAIRIVAR